MKHSHGEWCESLGSHGVCCESADYMGINGDSQGEITYISYYESVIHHKAVLVSGDGNKIIMVSGMDHETVVLGAGSNKQWWQAAWITTHANRLDSQNCYGE